MLAEHLSEERRNWVGFSPLFPTLCCWIHTNTSSFFDISCVFFQLMNSENQNFGSRFQIHLRHKLQNFPLSNCSVRQIYHVFLVAVTEHIPFLKIVQESSSERTVLLPLKWFPHWKLGLRFRWTQKSLSKVEEEVEEAFLQVHKGGKLWQRWWKCFQKANRASLLPSHLASASYPGKLQQVP